MEITRRSTGQRPDSHCKTAAVAIHGASTSGGVVIAGTDIAESNRRNTIMVLHLVT
jgi:hypothetical protein